MLSLTNTKEQDGAEHGQTDGREDAGKCGQRAHGRRVHVGGARRVLIVVAGQRLEQSTHRSGRISKF